MHRNVSASVTAILGVHAYSDGDSMVAILLKDTQLLLFFIWGYASSQLLVCVVNNEISDSLNTPVHIEPEWYFTSV